jgi:hypothetical protein
MLSLQEDNKLDDLTSKLIHNSNFIQAYLASNVQLADMLKAPPGDKFASRTYNK